MAGEPAAGHEVKIILKTHRGTVIWEDGHWRGPEPLASMVSMEMESQRLTTPHTMIPHPEVEFAHAIAKIMDGSVTVEDLPPPVPLSDRQIP